MSFTVTMKLGDLSIRESELNIEAAKKAGQDTAQAEKEFLTTKTDEYRRRVGAAAANRHESSLRISELRF